MCKDQCWQDSGLQYSTQHCHLVASNGFVHWLRPKILSLLLENQFRAVMPEQVL